LRGYDLARLRFTVSVGEPLSAQVVVWARRGLGLPFHDNWWQTDTESIMIANFLAMGLAEDDVSTRERST
jgi:acetyl-CoA synthetase